MENQAEDVEKQNKRIDKIKKASIFVWAGYFILVLVLEFYLNIHFFSPGVFSLLGFIVMILGMVATFKIGGEFFKS